MKSLASSDVSTNSCSSKFHWQAKMLFRVWLSSSPRKGQRPLRLTRRSKRSLTPFCINACACVCVLYLQHVGDDTEAPHVCVKRHKVVVDDFRSKKLRSAEIDSQFLPWFISMWGHNQWHFTFCMITTANKTVSKTEANARTYILARPKSMILILFVALFTHRIFSGWNSRQNTWLQLRSFD